MGNPCKNFTPMSYLLLDEQIKEVRQLAAEIGISQSRLVRMALAGGLHTMRKLDLVEALKQVKHDKREPERVDFMAAIRDIVNK